MPRAPRLAGPLAGRVRRRVFSTRRSRILAATCALFLAAAAPVIPEKDKDPNPIIRPEAAGQTTPVPHPSDSADDPAIWLHPTEPERSLILGTDKNGGLISYDMDGKQLQVVSDGSKPDNVDVLYDFPLAGKKVDLAVAGCRGTNMTGMKIWTIDAKTRRLNDVTAGGTIPVFDHTPPYGSGVYHSHKTDKFYAFMNNRDGKVEQYELTDAGVGRVGAKKVRAFKLPNQVEGCVADDELGFVYIAEEARGVWRFDAEPDGGNQGKLVIKAWEHMLRPDVEGLTLYCAAGGKGYLIVSSQGNNTFKLYTRDGDNTFVATIDPKEGAIDDVNDTDGIAVTNRPTSAKYPKGFFVVQDGSTPGKNQNFKMYKWEDIAGDKLTIDTTWDPRK